jgi:hypothetical protein
MKYPEHQKPLVTRVMQHFDGIDEIPNIHTTWDRKVEKLQKDEQGARRHLQTIANRYPGILESLIALITRMEEATHDIGSDVFFIATDTVNDIMAQVRQLIGPKYERKNIPIHERQNVLDQERIETNLLQRLNMFLPSGHVINGYGHHTKPRRKTKDILDKGRDKTYHAEGDWNEEAYTETIIGQSDGTVSFYHQHNALRLHQVTSHDGMKLGELISPLAFTLPGKATEDTQDIIKPMDIPNTEQEEYPATRENYLRITREITDPTSDEYITLHTD